MAKKRKSAKKTEKYQLWGMILFCIGILWGLLVVIKGESLWSGLRTVIFGLFGGMTVGMPVLCIYQGIIMAKEKKTKIIHKKLILSSLIFLTLGGIIQMSLGGEQVGEGMVEKVKYLYINGAEFQGAGAIGGWIGIPLEEWFGKWGGIGILGVSLFFLVMVFMGKTLIDFLEEMKKRKRKIEDYGKDQLEKKRERVEEKEEERRKRQIHIPLEEERQKKRRPGGIDIPLFEEKHTPEIEEKTPEIEEKTPEIEEKTPETEENTSEIEEILKRKPKEEKKEEECPWEEVNSYVKEEEGEYSYPSLSFLKEGEKKSKGGETQELKGNAERLIETLKNFGVKAKMLDISKGPSVTRYELQPDIGVKISKITGLADDIALSLAAGGIRIEAPIPNKCAIGIEVPNQKVEIVKGKEILSSKEFREAQSKVTVALGKDISGKIIIGDLSKMPHLLVAGATGSGKSVCINTIITSILYKANPEEVRLLMIDPKVVELGIYNGIPHLLLPVVTDAKKASGALGWAVGEMLRRYRMFAESNVRDLKGYNQTQKHKGEKELPQIVIIIDELADLMMASPREVEDGICRLAQMARAAGMYLVIATQRPSVDVITGTIKANIPSRIAFSVSSQVDSRTILDTGGAEKLLGRGDMLYYPVGASKPTRVQGCYIDDEEVERVVNYIKSTTNAQYDEEVIEEIEKGEEKGEGNPLGEEGDPMIEKAIETAVELGQISTSLLQRKLRLGYARAARIVDELEDRGIVSKMEGSKPRQVQITREQWIEMKMRRADGDK